MDLVINANSGKPIYLQLYECITSQILSGELPQNEMLPSIRTVARELKISIITVKNAWEKLEADGYIYTRAGIGCFVTTEGANLKQKALNVIEERIKKDIEYYKNSGITKKELIDIIERNY